MGDAPGLQGCTVGAAACQRLAILPNTQRKQLLGLLKFEPPKLFHRKRWKCDSAIVACFRVLEPKFSLGLLKALDDAQNAPLKINILPAQCENFATPHTGGYGKQNRPIHTSRFGTLQKALRFIGTQSYHRFAFNLRQSLLEYVRGVPSEDLLANGSS